MPVRSEPPPTRDRQVLVIGDSVEGLATAAFLRQDGLSPVVVTAGTDQSGRARDVTLWRAAVSLLAELDGDDLLAAGTPVERWRLRRLDDGSTEQHASTRDAHPVLSVDRARLRDRLRAQLPAESVRLSKAPQRLVPNEHGVRVGFADGVRERFDAVVGADGVDSWGRDSRTAPSTPASWGTAEWSVLTEGLFERAALVDVWAASETLLCHPDGRARFVVPAVDTADTAVAREAATARLDDLLDRVAPHESTPALGERTEHVGTASDCWAVGRVGFVGPAARSLPPTSSLGPSLAVEDAYVLATELTSRRRVVTALDRYARRRRNRLTTLARQVPFQCSPTGTQQGPAAVHAARSVRRTVVRSFFTTSEPAVSAAGADYL